MSNDYMLVIEYKIKLISPVTYRKRYYYNDKTLEYVENEEEVIIIAFSRVGFFPISSVIYNNNNRILSTKCYEYHA